MSRTAEILVFRGESRRRATALAPCNYALSKLSQVFNGHLRGGDAQNSRSSPISRVGFGHKSRGAEGGGGAGKCREARDRIHLPTEEPSRPRRFASLFPSPSLITSRSPLLNSILIRFALSRAIMRAFHALARAPRRDNKIDRWRRKTLNAAPHHAAATLVCFICFLRQCTPPPPPPRLSRGIN